MKKVYILIFFLLSTVTCTLFPTYAADSTPSADIKAKLEELKKEIASRAAKLKNEVDKKLKDKAFVGKVKSSSSNSITLAARSGPKIVSVNQDTVFESQVKVKKKFSQSTIAEEDYLVALGDVDETGVLIAKKVILLTEVESVVKTYFWGQVVAISDKLITIKNNGLKNIAVSLPENSIVKLNNFIILTGFLGENEIFEAEFIHIIPQGGFIKPKSATPSAKEATKSATSKPTSH